MSLEICILPKQVNNVIRIIFKKRDCILYNDINKYSMIQKLTIHRM